MIKRPHDLKSYRKTLKQALQNEFLSKSLNNFVTASKTSRENVYSEIDFEALRTGISDFKDDSISHLDERIEQFTSAAGKAGITVHFARNALEANSIIASIAKAGGAKKIVKSKSMTAEETFLNDHLERDGFEVTETDLGEWIIQLRHEGPSHMVMPAIHLSRREVAETFMREVGGELDPDDIEGMLQFAKRELRQKFLEADMGISGANFLIAETGSMGVVTNEGNARLVTTLPRIHVALAGVEKILPNVNAALRVLQALPRSSMGMPISTYVTWITGPTECRSAPDARKEMHVVLLDNGRRALAKDPLFSQVLRCIRCGACANVCPIYRLVGGHQFGHVYIGAIGLILTYFYHGRENARALVKNCMNCLACKAVCPAGIDLPHLIKQVHSAVLQVEDTKPVENNVLKRVLPNRRLFHSLLRVASHTQKPLVHKQYLRHLPLLFSGEHGFRSLPALAKAPLRDLWQRNNPRIANPRWRVAVFGGCLNDFIYPEQVLSLLWVSPGYKVQFEYPMDQTCCGLPAMMVGENPTAVNVAVQNIKAMEPSDFDYIITLCASCASHLKENYPRILGNEKALGVKATQFGDRIIDYSSFMMNVLTVKPEQFVSSRKKVTYHAPCHLCRGLGVTSEPRELLRTAGFEYVASKDEDVCCGFGGSYSIDFPEMSAEMLKRKLDNAEATGAEYLVSECPGCVMQLRGGMEKRRTGIKVKHTAELIAEARK